MTKEKLESIGTRFLLFFIVSAFIGWLYEIVLTYFAFHRYEDRGVLHLPLCPIYGFGMIILFACLYKVKNGFLIILYSSLITTVIELVASYILDYAFDMELWNYEDWPFDYQGRVSVFSSLIFGLLAVFAFKLIFPLINNLYAKNKKIVTIATIVITIVAVVVQIIGVKNSATWLI